MRTIRMKIILGILLCSILTAILVGVLNIGNSMRLMEENTQEQLIMTGKVEAGELNTTITSIEQSVNFLSELVMQDFDFAAFQKEKDYADEYTDRIEDTVNNFAIHTSGAITAYVRYNPEYSNPASGVFFSRNSTEEAFGMITPTDFSMYEEDDVEHVGWYYIPVKNGAAMWMDPYLNQNINVHMISYVVPLFAEDGTSIGIVGMDIDFSQFTDEVDKLQVLESGYAFLVKEDGTIMHHRDLEMGTDLSDADASLQTLSTVFSEEERQGEAVEYSYLGQKKQMVYYGLNNGMKLVLTISNSEIYTEIRQILVIISIGILLAVIISGVVGVYVGSSIAKPIKQLTNIIVKTAQFDFASTPEGKILRKRNDETGKMAGAVHEMRNMLRSMVKNIHQVENTILNSVENLGIIMKENRSRSEDNSAATQEIAAGMQEASTNTADIAESIDKVKRNEEDIYRLAQSGEKNSEQILDRAGEMEKVSRESSEKIHGMYDIMKQQTDEAIEKSKAVQRINELTEDIKEISSQTNLLALNASIEAARAGDAGKGFAVVATEIGSLATQTFQTVDNINVIVNEVNDAVSDMTKCIVTMMEFLGDTVLGDYNMFCKTGGQYREDADAFIHVMQQIRSAIEALDQYMSKIVASVDDINNTVSQSSDGINVIAEKSSKTASTIMEGFERLRESRESVDALREIVEQFKMGER